MEMDYLREFIVFSKTMNYSKASAELFVSQPTLRAHMKAIEDEIGALLTLKRDGRLDLTPVGKLLLTKAQEIIVFTEEAFNECRNCSQQVSSLLVSDLAFPQFRESLSEAKDTYAKNNAGQSIEIRLSSGMGSNIEAIEGGGVDLALFSYVREDNERPALGIPRLPPNVISAYHQEAEVFFWASKENVIFEKETIVAEDLVDQTLMLGHSKNMTRAGRLIAGFFESKGVSIGLCECPFSSYSEYRFSGTSNTFGITHLKPDASNKGWRVFEIDDLTVLSDLFILANRDTVCEKGMSFLRLLSKNNNEEKQSSAAKI